ncbi:uroporphyrinogen-III synthase [Noviherbaspirillum sp. UKPF54]|uniref:uroporphyrinogen-III synthase n=1 Tax=Noviherbaspirillum sp. UKPF54 TaxID=2601898 RepID=UPI0011B17BA4|nr:uroporphyrinogen-III synthase [Noviherbaspirillum sp. UKPF54]QDZ28392.1 uroporphyrinogen III synthase [Noviherbaspirillum sp. UKPF54]
MTDQTARPVIITRPLAQATPLAQRVRDIGRHAVVFPLLDIEPLPDQTQLRAELHDLRRYAMVAFVSPNAINAAFAILPSWPREVAIAVVGEGSRQALAAHGVTDANATIFSPKDTERTDSQTLLEVLDIDALRGKRVLIVRGESGRELLADALRAQGVDVTPLPAYRRRAPALDDAGRGQLLSLLDAQGDWIITSSEALRILVEMVREAATEDGVAKLQQQHLVIPHVRIAETARSLGFTHLTQTASGDEPLLAALQF